MSNLNKSLWGLVSQSTSPEEAAQLSALFGNEALSSGLVSPAQAADNFKQVSPVLQQLGIVENDPIGRALASDQKSQAELTGSVNVMAGPTGAVKVAPPNMKSGTKVATSQDILYSDKQLADKYNKAANLDIVQGLQADRNKIQDLLSMEAQAPTDIYSGAIANLLTQNGNNAEAQALSSNRGASPQDQRAKLLGYAGKLQESRQGIAKTISDFMDKQKSGTRVETQNDETSTGGTGTSKAPSMEAQKIKLFDAFRKDTKDDQAALGEAQNAEKTLLNGSKVGQQAFKTFLGRASGEKGPLSEKDIAMFSGDPSIVARLQRVFQKNADGSLTEADEADMKLLIKSYVGYRKDKLANAAKYFTEQAAPNIYGIDTEQAKRMLIPNQGFGLSQDKIEGVAKPGMISVISPDGATGKIPADKLAAAIAKGYKKAE